MVNKMDKALARLTKKKTQITNIEMKEEHYYRAYGY